MSHKEWEYVDWDVWHLLAAAFLINFISQIYLDPDGKSPAIIAKVAKV